MRYISLDTETDDINATKLWCIVCRDIKNPDVVFKFVSNSGTNFSNTGFSDETNTKYNVKPINDFLSIIQEEETVLVIHNSSFDLWVLEKFIGYYHDPKLVRDTWVMSQLFNQQRGGHSLADWGKRLGNYKDDFSDFTQFSWKMLEYCEQDTSVAVDIYLHLREEGKGQFTIECLLDEQRVARICREIEQRGHWLYYDKTVDLLANLESTRNTISYQLAKDKPKIPKENRLVKYKTTKSGVLAVNVTKPLIGYCEPEDIVGDYTLLDWEEFKVSSRQHCVYQLLLQGWKPTKFSDKTGAPTLDGDVLEEIADYYPETKDIAKYFLIDKRFGAVRSWLEHYNPKTGRVHGRINPIGCRTHRASHSNPNKGQIPSVSHDASGKVLWGVEGNFNAECRAVWGVPDGYQHIGVDAAAIQLVILAHAMGNKEYADAVAFGDKKKGTDVHTVNRNTLREATKQLLGWSDEQVAHIDRDLAKTFIYGYLLGAGGQKVELILKLPLGLGYGNKLKELFAKRTPGLTELRQRLKKEVETLGIVRGLDGRVFPCTDNHFALAYVLQGYEQAIMKKFMIRVDDFFKNNKIDGGIVAWVHDELQMEVKDINGWPELIKTECVKMLEDIGREFGLKCFLTGEAKPAPNSGVIGKSWLDSH